ncbi:MAG TPA: carboxypeptidase-like regulatory domain-containing protein, partial [Vicinamibacterales bacterium]
QLADDKGAPIVDGTVIAFSTDTEKWTEDSRFVQSARPDQEGKYRVRALPAGEYFVVAVNYVEEGMWNDPEFLDSVRRSAQKVSLGDADTQTASLKLITP